MDTFFLTCRRCHPHTSLLRYGHRPRRNSEGVRVFGLRSMKQKTSNTLLYLKIFLAHYRCILRLNARGSAIVGSLIYEHLVPSLEKQSFSFVMFFTRLIIRTQCCEVDNMSFCFSRFSSKLTAVKDYTDRCNLK